MIIRLFAGKVVDVRFERIEYRHFFYKRIKRVLKLKIDYAQVGLIELK